jgi:hypothetical protein
LLLYESLIIGFNRNIRGVGIRFRPNTAEEATPWLDTETNLQRRLPMSEERINRRDVIKKAAYMAPVILTFLAAPSFASGGSGSNERYERHEKNKRKGRRWWRD